MVGVLLEIPGAFSVVVMPHVGWYRIASISFFHKQYSHCSITLASSRTATALYVWALERVRFLYLTIQHIMTFHMPSRSTGISPM